MKQHVPLLRDIQMLPAVGIGPNKSVPQRSPKRSSTFCAACPTEIIPYGFEHFHLVRLPCRKPD
jgi:hypothetical protein